MSDSLGAALLGALVFGVYAAGASALTQVRPKEYSMAVQTRRSAPALLVLLVLFASQIGYAADLLSRPSEHCAGEMPSEQPCRLPLWLTCCDDHAAVQTGANAPAPASTLALPIETSLVAARRASAAFVPTQPRVPPGAPLLLSVVLLI